METNRGMYKELREKALNKVDGKDIDVTNLSLDEIQKAYHELSVHQVELELQNEELRRVQQNLEQKKDEYFHLFNNAPNGYAILDSNGIIVQANRQLQEIFSTDLTNILNVAFNSFLGNEDSRRFISIYKSFFKNPENKDFQYRTSNKYIRIFGRQYHSPEIKITDPLLMLTVIDITDFEKANRQIERDAKLYSSIIHNSLEGFWLLNKQGNFIDVNETACNMLGYSKEELVGSPVSLVTTNKDSKEIEEQIEKLLVIKEEKFLSQHTRKDGHIIDVEVCTSALTKSGRELLVAFIRDVSHEVITEKILNKRIHLLEFSANHTVDETMQKALDFAEELTRSKISFWHHISPDMNNVLLQQWSKNTMEANCTAEGHNKHANIDEAGIWADCIKLKKAVIHNDYNSIENKKGLPEGHADLYRQLIVPIIKDDKIVAIIGVGNKKTDYVQDDIKIMETFGNVAWMIYEKKYTSDTLVKSENKNKAILGLLPDILFEFSFNGDFLNYHASDYSKLFLEPEQFLNKNIFEVLPLKVAQQIKYNIDKAVTTGEMVSFEYSSFIEDTYQYFAVRIVEFSSNSVLCFMRDITEKQVAKELIIESEEKFSTVFFNSPLIKSIIDIKTNKFIDINKKFIEITGFTKEDALNNTATEIGLLSLNEKKKILTELNSKGEVRDLLVEYTKKNGDKLICNYTTELVKISGKEFVLNIAQDITEKYKVEQELEDYRNELEEKVKTRTEQLSEVNNKLESRVKQLKAAEETIKDSLHRERELNKLKTQFISMASHEFRTPLTTILSSAELIETYLGKLDEVNIYKHSKKIQDSVNKMIFLLSEVLRLSKSENPHMELNLVPTNIKNFIQKIIEDVEQTKFENQKITLDVNDKTNLYLLDPNLLQHIISNLLANSIKYAYKDSEITLTTDIRESNMILTLSDDGPGIYEHELKNIFEPFYRGENSKDIQGSGIGLSVVKSFVELHNGTINVNSILNKGTTFKIIIPVEKVEKEGNNE